MCVENVYLAWLAVLSPVHSASFPVAAKYTGAQPGVLGRHDSAKVIIPLNFNGQVLTAENGSTVDYAAGMNQQSYVINNSDGARSLSPSAR